MKFWLAIILLILPAGCAHTKGTPYETSSADQRSNFKKVMLPLSAGTRFKISSGAFGCCTHNLRGFEYAWDFDVPYGTPVLAVDNGLVIQVWEPYAGGGCDQKYNDSAHNIKIAAADGTVAQYVHVQSAVHLGQIVKKGDIIAVTANNGFHCVPQLHFNIFQDREHIPERGQAKTIPVLFEGLPDEGMAHEGYEGSVLSIVNWGDSFAAFWERAKGASFEKQLSLWDELVESPHKKFYSTVVWQNTGSPDFLERKTKRLKDIFSQYAEKAPAIQSGFNNFSATIESQVSRFYSTFPSAKFEVPIMAVPGPTFNGKSDSYEDHGQQHFLAFGIDTLTIRNDNPDVLYSHELFHIYHGKASGIKDDGASEGATLMDSLWAEGLATYVSKELNTAASMGSVFMDESLAATSENRLPYLSKEFLKVKDEQVHSEQHPEVYGYWFLLNRCPASLSPCRSGYFLGYHVAKFLRKQYTLDEMAHWSFRLAQEKITPVLEKWAGKIDE